MWVRAVWLEEDIEEEGVIPECWISKGRVFWPASARNVPKLLKAKTPPEDNWLSFKLLKIKMKTEKYQEAMRYDYTTSVDTEEDDELEGSKRKPKAKQFEDFVTDQQSDKQKKLQKNPDDDSRLELPIPPTKVLQSAKETSTFSRGAARGSALNPRSPSPNEYPSISQLLENSQKSLFSDSDKSRSPSPSILRKQMSHKSLFSSTPLNRTREERSLGFRSRSPHSQRSKSRDKSPTRVHRQRSKSREKSHTHSQRSQSRERSVSRGQSQRSQSRDRSVSRGQSQRSQSRDRSVSRGYSQRSQSRDRSVSRGYSQRSQSRDRSNSHGHSRWSHSRGRSHYYDLSQRSQSRDKSQSRDRSHGQNRRSQSRDRFNSYDHSQRSQYRSRSRDIDQSLSRSKVSTSGRNQSSRGPERVQRSKAVDKGMNQSQQEEEGPFPMSTARFQRRVLYLLCDIRKELQGGQRTQSVAAEEYSIARAESMDEFHQLEEDAKIPDKRKDMVAMLSKVGGSGLRSNVQRIMERLMTNKLMAKFNLKGGNKNGKLKLAFKPTHLMGVITASVMKTRGNGSCTEAEIDKDVGHCLKYAPDRRGGGGRDVQAPDSP